MEISSPRLTVIIPAYNGMPFLKDAVESILSQTYTNLHLLIINDGSKDNTAEYLNSLDDQRIEVIHQENMGLCRSLNKAIIERTDSEFVARLDQDDISFPSRLEEQMNFMLQNPNYACVLSNISRIGINGKEFGSYQTSSDNEIDNYDLQRYGSIVHSTILFRRDKFIEAGGYKQEFYPVDDHDLLLKFSELAPVAVIKKPLVKYRIHGKAGTFSSFWKMQTNTRYVEEMHQRRKNGKSEIPLDQWLEFNKPSAVEQFKRYFNGTGQLLFRQAGCLIGEGKKLKGSLYLLGAFFCNPRFTATRLLALFKSKSKSFTFSSK